MNLVNSREQVVRNVRSFNEGLEQSNRLREKLPYFRAWYYDPEPDMVGPSKYIGYQDIDPESFLKEADLDGRETEPIMVKWFDRLDEDSPEYRYAYDKVADLVARYGKNMNRVARVGAPRGWRLNRLAGQQASDMQPENLDEVVRFWLCLPFCLHI
jgi:5-methylcytosine-specific restriction protein A